MFTGKKLLLLLVSSLLFSLPCTAIIHLERGLEGLHFIESEATKLFTHYDYVQNKVTVNVSELGRITGYRQKLVDYRQPLSSQSVEVYLGIPYAEPPVGEWRFKAPRAKTAWIEARNATEYGAACPQPVYYGKLRLDESCLFLNIFTPNTSATTALYPVMVFIHGGEFTYGASDLYPGHQLAFSQNVVVVTFNYRLGALGFAALNDQGRARANYGLLDQRLALQWVRNYIKYFHGDPNSVTLFGHGAGAACVGMHMLSPNSSNLFNRAIMQSGCELAPWAVVPSWTDALENTASLARELKCNEGSNTRSRNSAQTLLQCLQSRDALDIGKAVFQPTAGSFYPWAPIVFAGVNSEYQILPQHPRDLLKSHLTKNYDSPTANVPLMIGITTQDGARYIKPRLSRGDLQPQMSRSDLTDAVQNMLSKLYRKNAVARVSNAEAQRNLITEYYSPRVVDDDRQKTLHLAVLNDLYTDAYFVGPMQLESQLRAFDSMGKSLPLQKKQPLFQYVLNSALKFDNRSAWDRTMNGDDLWLLFGFPFLLNYSHIANIPYGLNNRYYNSRSGDRDLSTEMMRMWADFARYSNPTATGNVAWEPYTVEQPAYLLITTARQLEKSHDVTQNYRHLSGNFWMHVLPQMLDFMLPADDSVHRWQLATWMLTVVAGVLLLAFAGTVISYYRFRHNVRRGYWGRAK